MPQANCQACVVGIGVIPNPQGSRNEPFGTCHNCHSLACGHHGHRDPNVPEFMCVECDPALLAASAVTMATVPSAAFDDIRAAYRLHLLAPERWVVRSIEDFVARRPGYGLEFFAPVRNVRFALDQPTDESNLREALLYLTEEGRSLMAAAFVVIRRLEISGPRLARYLQRIEHFIEWRQ